MFLHFETGSIGDLLVEIPLNNMFTIYYSKTSLQLALFLS